MTSAQEVARKRRRIEPEAQTLAQLQGRMRDWLYKEALPQWAEHGVDPRTMTFVEQRNLDGSPDLKAPRRFRVQARQIFTFCKAAERGWCGDARALLEPIIENVTSLYWHRNGGWVFRIAADGSTSDDGRECYEQMFALLAFAGVYQTFRSQAALDWIDKTLALLDDHYYDAVRGGFAESIPWKLPRRQNPHMHYLEAMLALYEATEDRYFLTRAATAVTLFREKFFDLRTGTLCETFGSEWNRDSGPSGHKVEPGHHFEWVWLLDRYGHASGDHVGEADQLYDFALSRGLSSTDEFVVDGLSSEGAIIAGTKRLWPQTEMLKALVSKSRRGDAKAMRRIAPHVERMVDKYFIPGNGCWHDQLDAEGNVISTLSPASTFYHIYVALEELLAI